MASDELPLMVGFCYQDMWFCRIGGRGSPMPFHKIWGARWS